MDRFFSIRNCERCGAELTTRTMSKMNSDVICIGCKEQEKQHPRYKEASDREMEEVRRGNYNYGGLFKGQEYPFK